MTSSANGYSIELIDPADSDAVAAAYGASWAGDSAPPLDIRRRCEWLYLGNPAGRARIFALQSPAGTPVGMLAVAPRRFSMGGKLRTLGLLCDFIVHKSHRTGLPALLLQRAARRSAEAAGWGTYAVPNPKSLRVIQRLGGQTAIQRPRMARPMRHHGYLSRSSYLPLTGVAWGLDILTWAWDVGLSTALRRYGTEWRDDFDVVPHDALWKRVAPSVCMGERNSAFLRWRFQEEPNRNNLVLAILCRNSTELAAYAVGELHGQSFGLRDLLIDRTAIPARSAIALLLRRVRAIGAASISFHGCTDPTALRALRLLGFRDREFETVLIHGCSKSDVAGLQLTRADEDV